MSNRKLYFAKVNLNSHIYDYYDGKIEMDEIIKSILFNINEVDIFKEENIYKDEVVYEANYSFYNINKKNELGIIYGQILKRGSIIIKSVDKNKNEISKKPIENDELIKFYYDIENELIIFHVTNRYGYLQFCSSFQNLLNRCMESNGSELKFIVTLLRESVSVNSMREKLNKLRGINWLKVSIMPPNPNENVLRNIRKNGKKYLSKYKEGNITGISTIGVVGADIFSFGKLAVTKNCDARVLSEEEFTNSFLFSSLLSIEDFSSDNSISLFIWLLALSIGEAIFSLLPIDDVLSENILLEDSIGANKSGLPFNSIILSFTVCELLTSGDILLFKLNLS